MASRMVSSRPDCTLTTYQCLLLGGSGAGSSATATSVGGSGGCGGSAGSWASTVAAGASTVASGGGAAGAWTSSVGSSGGDSVVTGASSVTMFLTLTLVARATAARSNRFHHLRSLSF